MQYKKYLSNIIRCYTVTKNSALYLNWSIVEHYNVLHFEHKHLKILYPVLNVLITNNLPYDNFTFVQLYLHK